MKRFLLIIAFVVLCLSIVACGGKNVTEQTTDEQTNQTTEVGGGDYSTEDETSDNVITEEGTVDKTPDNDQTEILDDSIFESLSYVAFGDSITYGELPFLGTAMAEPYVKIVSKTLGFESYTIYARGGATLNDATNMPEWRPCMTNTILSFNGQADIISVMLGTNDYTYPLPLGQMGDKTTESAYGSLYLIAEHLTTNYPNAFIFFMTPYKCVYGDMVYNQNNALGYCMEDYANAVKEVASEFGIPVLDMFNEGSFELEMYKPTSDGVHPSQEFVRSYTAPQIAEFIRQNYRGK